MESLQQTEHFARRGAAEAELLAPLGGDRRVAAIDLGVEPRVREIPLRHQVGRGGETDLIDHQVRRGVVRVRDHQPNGIAHGKLHPGREVLCEDARTGDFVFLFQDDGLRQIEHPVRRLLIRSDHHRELDETRRRHRFVGPMRERRPRLQMLHADRDGPLVSRNHRLK